MPRRSTQRTAVHAFWCGVLFVGLMFMVFPTHWGETPSRVAAHRCGIVAITNLTLSAPGSTRDSLPQPENQLCRRRSKVAETGLVAEGVDPVDVSWFVILPNPDAHVPSPLPLLPARNDSGLQGAGVQRSRAPPS